MRYNDSLTRSRALRARIDSLRRERLLFEELYGKLQRGLTCKKGDIVEVIAHIVESHEAREKVGGQASGAVGWWEGAREKQWQGKESAIMRAGREYRGRT